MSTLKTPFRYDFVGSFLRPEKLKAAKKTFEEGTITQEELDRVTDECVTEIVAKQKVAGYHAITDGEFRRRYWHLDFLADLDGVEEIKSDHWSVHFKGHQPKAATLKIADKVDFGEHPFLEHFKYLMKRLGYVFKKDAWMEVQAPGFRYYHKLAKMDEIFSEETLRHHVDMPWMAKPYFYSSDIRELHRAKLSSFQKKFYAKLYRLRIIEQKRFAVGGAKYTEDLKGVHR